MTAPTFAGRPRKPVEARRQQVAACALTADEYASFDAACRGLGLSKSDFLRRVLLAAVRAVSERGEHVRRALPALQEGSR